MDLSLLLFPVFTILSAILVYMLVYLIKQRLYRILIDRIYSFFPHLLNGYEVTK